jgi:hypothetical protein
MQSMKKQQDSFAMFKRPSVPLSYREPAFQAPGVPRHGVAAKPIVTLKASIGASTIYHIRKIRRRSKKDSQSVGPCSDPKP